MLRYHCPKWPPSHFPLEVFTRLPFQFLPDPGVFQINDSPGQFSLFASTIRYTRLFFEISFDGTIC